MRSDMDNADDNSPSRVESFEALRYRLAILWSILAIGYIVTTSMLAALTTWDPGAWMVAHILVPLAVWALVGYAQLCFFDGPFDLENYEQMIGPFRSQNRLF